MITCLRMNTEYFTSDEIRYMDYLEEIFDAPNYGLLYRKGDPIAFEIGMNEWLREQDEYN